MKISIKILKGDGCELEVSPTSTILEVKQKIDNIMKIPALNQKLLLLGRPLNDELQILSYPAIKDGTKLNLVIMKPDTLRDVIYRAFRKYYSEPQSEKLTNEFIADSEKKFKMFSLDDLEIFSDSLVNHVPDP